MRKQFAIYLLFIPFEGMLGWDRDSPQKNDNDLLIRRCSLISLGDNGYIDKFPPRLGMVQHTIEHVYWVSGPGLDSCKAREKLGNCIRIDIQSE